MSKYKAGDKFLLEVTAVNDTGFRTLYEVNGMSGLFSENVLERLDPVVQCKECEARTNRVLYDDVRKHQNDSEYDEAAKAWNTRKSENAVLQGLVKMKAYEGHGEGILYSVDGIDYTVDQMIEEIRNGTDTGNEFAQSVYDTIISYMGKFSQETNKRGDT